MTDTLKHQSPLTRNQESLIAVLVILLFGLIYWFLIYDDHQFNKSNVESSIATKTNQIDTIDHSRLVKTADSGKQAALVAQLEAETDSLQGSEATRLKAEENVRRLTTRVTLDDMARRQMEADRLQAEDAARQLTTQLTAEQAARKEAEVARLKSEEEARQLTAQLTTEQAALKEAEAARLKAEEKVRQQTSTGLLKAEEEIKQLADQLTAETASRKAAEAALLKAEEEARQLDEQLAAAKTFGKEAEAAHLKAAEKGRQQTSAGLLKAEGEIKQLADQLAAETVSRKAAEAARLKAEAEARELAEQLAAEKTSREEAEKARLKSEAKAQKLAEERLVAEKESQQAEKELKQTEFTRIQFALPGGEAITIQEGGMVDQFKQAILGRRVNQPLVFDRIFFNTGSANLKSRASSQQVKEIAAVLHTYSEIDVSLRGHTDNIGSPALNKALSFERSANLKKALVALGIPAEHIHTEGMGATQPIADNSTVSGRFKNRRIDIVIVE